MKKRLGWSSNDEVAEIAQHLGVKHEEVREMERRLNAMDESYDSTSVGDDDASYKVAPADYLHDQSTNPAYIFAQEDADTDKHDSLYSALESLDDRSQDILQQRWLSEDKAITLHTLAEKYGISAERVRQLEKNAMKKLRQHIEGH